MIVEVEERELQHGDLLQDAQGVVWECWFPEWSLSRRYYTFSSHLPVKWGKLPPPVIRVRVLSVVECCRHGSVN